MADFPNFMRNAANRIALSSQFTEEIEGYVFDGVDGSQAGREQTREYGRPTTRNDLTNRCDHVETWPSQSRILVGSQRTR